MPVYKDEKTNTWYCKFYYTDYTGTKKQKLKRGFAMIEKGYSDSYLDRMQNLITTIFNYTAKYYNLSTNPCDKADRMGKRTRSQNFWALEEFNSIIALVTDPAAKTAMLLLFYSGIRFGELIALTYSDFNFIDSTISITKSKQRRAKTRDIVTLPKTENGIRTISMPETIMKSIKEYTDRIYGITNDTYIFTFSKTLISNNIKRCSAATGIDPIRIHDLRHSHVSLLIEMGFSPLLIAERIGDTVQIVNTIYEYLYPTKHKEVANKLNDLIVSKKAIHFIG